MTDIVKKYGITGEQRALLSRICDLVDLANEKDITLFSNFLSPPEQALISNATEFKKYADISFNGGFNEADRKIAVISPKNANSEIDYPISTLALIYKGECLTHRDILGSLMGIGIKREKIGDIIATAKQQIIICDDKIAEYIKQNLIKAGRLNVEVVDGKIENIPQKDVEIINVTVASLRLDIIVAEGFNLPRAKAAEAIKSGVVSLNWVVTTSVSKEVCEFDKISFKGKGKIELVQIGGQSKKGRTFIEIHKFL